MPANRGPVVVSIIGLAVFVAGCSKSEGGEASGARPPAGSPVSGPGGSAGARGGQTLTLAPTDISVITRTAMVDGIAITGTLRPIETVEVRARLEGDLEGIYVREGDFVRAGQLLARFESSEQESGVQSAAAERAAAQGDLATAEWNLKQSEDLYKAGAIAEGEVRVARNTVATARARLAASASRLRSSSSGRRDTRVLAPTSGMVEKRYAENGEHIARGGELFTLVRSDVLELAAAVPEKLGSVVARGQRVQFLANGQPIEGRVARVSPTVDPASRSVTVYVQVPNATGALKGGTFATGTVLARTIAGALSVPTSAIRQSVDGKPLVYRVIAGVLDTAQVVLGVQDYRAGIAEVTAGLNEGDSVVSGNVGSLGKGMKVVVLNPNAGRGRGAPRAGPATPARQP